MKEKEDKDIKSKWSSYRSQRLKEEYSNISNEEAVSDYKKRKGKELESSKKSDKSFLSFQKKVESFSPEKKFSKILGKTSVKLPSYSATKLIKSMGREQGALVREEGYREPVEENRSVMFKEEFRKERNNSSRWLLR